MNQADRVATMDERHRSYGGDAPSLPIPGPKQSWLRGQWGTIRQLWRDGYGLDEIILHRLLTVAVKVVWYAYTAPRGFLWAHILGPVSWVTAQIRAEVHCNPCPDRQGDYCGAEHGGRGCSCPRRGWWPFGKLRWKRRLRNWLCPRGRWGRFG